MIIETMVLGLFQTNTYIVYNEDTGGCVIIDPAYEPERILEYVVGKGLKTQAILVTHGHFDHIGACEVLKEQLGVEVVASAIEADIMEDAAKNLSSMFVSRKVEAKATRLASHGSTLDFGEGLVFKCIEVAGHSPGSLCYYNTEAGVVFTGDTLMAGTIGRTDFYQGSMETLVDHIRYRLMLLPKETKVYGGHGGPTTIGREMKDNPYVGGGLWR